MVLDDRHLLLCFHKLCLMQFTFRVHSVPGLFREVDPILLPHGEQVTFQTVDFGDSDIFFQERIAVHPLVDFGFVLNGFRTEGIVERGEGSRLERAGGYCCNDAGFYTGLRPPSES